MKLLRLFQLIFLFTLPLTAQTGDPNSKPALPSPDKMKAMLAESFKKNTFAYLPGPYHFLAKFETFARNGNPDGEGTIEKFFAAPGHIKVITNFRGHTSTAYYSKNKWQYLDDGFEGSLMSYFVNDFLLNPLPPPTGTARRDFEMKAMQLRGDALDCGMYQFFVEPPGYPTPRKEMLCISHDGGDLVLKQTLVFSVRYQDFTRFLDRSIPRYIYASEGATVRCRIHIQKVDQQALDEVDLVPPGNASSSKSEPDWWATDSMEDIPQRHSLPPGLEQATSSNAGAIGMFLVLRSRTGAVKDVQPIYTPNADSEAAAIDALKQWSFLPLMRQGMPVETISSVHLRFTMH